MTRGAAGETLFDLRWPRTRWQGSACRPFKRSSSYLFNNMLFGSAWR